MYKLSVDKQVELTSLDAEWIELLKKAKECGLTIDEVRNFLENPNSFNRIKNA
ncbi:anti-repressor SinI family protein [Heyndrickxia sp. NPDC080065]|uniref:anti-repressor SinI family protein n=1 Tax=Heyndrickxia sp. NPDC080065 TaxID=3390568 RepID=UPI003CFF5C56